MSMTASVLAKCIGCGKERVIRSGEIAPGDHPMCDCGMPMIAEAAVWHDDKDDRADMHTPTQPGDMDLAGRPLKQGS
jgi:hypothetical protein